MPLRPRLRHAGYALYLVATSWLLLELAGLFGLVDWRDKLAENPVASMGFRPVPHVDVRSDTYMDTAWNWRLPHDPVPFHFRTDARGFRNRRQPRRGRHLRARRLHRRRRAGPLRETVTARLEDLLGLPAMNLGLLSISPQRAQDVFREQDLPCATGSSSSSSSRETTSRTRTAIATTRRRVLRTPSARARGTSAPGARASPAA